MNGPCLCGDLYCPRCGNPEAAAREAMIERVGDLLDKWLTPLGLDFVMLSEARQGEYDMMVEDVANLIDAEADKRVSELLPTENPTRYVLFAWNEDEMPDGGWNHMIECGASLDEMILRGRKLVGADDGCEYIRDCAHIADTETGRVLWQGSRRGGC